MNVAIVKLSSLGDVVHALPVAAALRARLPEARITWMVERREAGLLRGHPAVDLVLPVDTRGWRRVRGWTDLCTVAGAVSAVLGRLRAGRYDVAIDLQGLLKSGLLTAATRAPLRVGFSARRCREPLSALFTNRRLTPPASARHVVDQQLALLVPLGIHEVRPTFALPTDAVAERMVADFFAAAGVKPRDRVVVVNPGAGRVGKQWPVTHFASLTRRLAGEMGATVLVVWGPSERERAEAIVAGARPARALLAPATDLAALGAVLRRASVVVGGDTGPLHLGAALGVPCVGLYGPTDPARNGPYGTGHRTLRSADGRMASIAPEAVLSAVVALLE
jgi:lipopolysaccharide heptosyltransferase I